MNKNLAQKKGFTLIELLVVISIIALLLSILMPSLNRVKKQAQQVVCQSNLRQLSTAYMMYLEDNENKYPTAYYFVKTIGDTELANCWYTATQPYLSGEKEIYLCPSAKKPESSDGSGHPYAAFDASYFHEDLPLFSYGHNDWVLSGWLGEPDSYPSSTAESLAWKTNMVKRSYKVPVLGDASYPIATDVWFYPAPPRPPRFKGDHGWKDTTSRLDQLKRFCLDRHNLGVNWTFMDNSVRKVGLKELWKIEFHKRWNRKNVDVDEYVEWPAWMRNSL